MKYARPLQLLLLSAMLAFPLSGAEPGGDTRADEAKRLRRLLSLAERSNSVYSVLEAAQAGDVEVLRERLKEGADPNVVDEQGNTPLHLAARGKSPKVVRLLLEAGADPTATDAKARTPRELCRNKKILKLLTDGISHRERELQTEALVKQGDCAGVRKAIKEGVNPNARTADKKGTLLLSAAQAGRVDMLRTLLSLGAKADACTVDTGLTALHIAAQRGHAAIITLLLQAGADPMKKATNGATALHDAVWHNRLESVTALLPAYKQVNFSPDGGHHPFPINMAILRSPTELVRAFLVAGLNPNDPRFRQTPPLVLATRQQRADCVQLFLEAGADKQARDAAGKTAADYASPSLQTVLR